MLILMRNPGRAITVGDDIVIRVLEVNGSQVKIGVNAPKNIAVHREEIYNRIIQDRIDKFKIEEGEKNAG